MKDLSIADFFKGLISRSVDKGNLKIWSPYGVRVAQPFQGNDSNEELQAILYIIRNEDGEKFYVAMSKDGEKCAISNDELMAYELYWSAERPAGYDGVRLNSMKDLERWEQPTVQVAQGTVGFVIDENNTGKYVTVGNGKTEYLPQTNFLETLERILQELQEAKESIEGMPGKEYCKNSLTETYENSINNIYALLGLADEIARAYEENEIKENMAEIANLRQELIGLYHQIAELEHLIINGGNTLKNRELLNDLKTRRYEIAEKIGLDFLTNSDDTSQR